MEVIGVPRVQGILVLLQTGNQGPQLVREEVPVVEEELGPHRRVEASDAREILVGARGKAVGLLT